MRRFVVVLALSCFTSACATADGGVEPETGTKSQPEAGATSEPKAVEAGDKAAEPSDGAPPPGVKVKGNVPVVTESELAAEDTKRDSCVAECVKSGQAQARAAEAIEADCRRECEQHTPIRQVEVVPDGPLAPGPGE